MKMRAFWVLGLALFLAGASVYLARDFIERQSRPTVVQQITPQVEMTKVVVAATPLFFGNRIRREHLREVDWPSDAVPPGAFTSIEEITAPEEKGAVGEKVAAEGNNAAPGKAVERVALRAIEINEPILRSKVSGFGGRASLSNILTPEMRASTIRVNDVNGVAGFVLPNDHVDIMLTRSPGGGKGSRGGNDLITDILLQNMKILAIDQDANEGRDKPSVVKTVTLEVTPVQAQKLVLAQRLGQLSLALRHATNTAAETPKTVSVRDLRVGEVNQFPGEQKPVKKTVVVKKTPKKKKVGLSVRIVRGLTASKYEVQPDRRPLFSAPADSKPLDLMPQISSAAEPEPAAWPASPAQGSSVAKPVSAPLSLLEPADDKAAALKDAVE